MTRLSGLHILLTYRCLSACDHCFVWGSPQQTGVFTRGNLLRALDLAREALTIRTVYFEGGEPFLYYPILVEGVRAAAERGFSVGIVSNGYWGTSVEDARLWLAPFVGLLSDLSISTDLLHGSTAVSPESRNILAACRQLGLPGSTLSCDAGDVMFRGRAASLLAGRAPHRPWSSFDECPHEDLEEPGRVHLDPAGNLHLCQGLVVGNLFARPRTEILDTTKPPIIRSPGRWPPGDRPNLPACTTCPTPPPTPTPATCATPPGRSYDRDSRSHWRRTRCMAWG
jgi:hypothetical protein